MYGFFAVGAPLSDAQIAAFLRGAGVQNFEIGEKRRHKHVFSHIEWTMLARVIELPDEKQLAAADETAGARAIGMPADTEISPFASLKYFTKAQIEADISLPSAFRWCMELL